MGKNKITITHEIQYGDKSSIDGSILWETADEDFVFEDGVEKVKSVMRWMKEENPNERLRLVKVTREVIDG